MTIAYQRNSFTKTVAYRETAVSSLEISLDWLSANYNNLFEQVSTVQSFVITDTEAGLPDVISYRFYNTEELWWLICVYNGIIDPLTELVTGLTIQIPDLDQSTVFLFQNSGTGTRAGSSVVI